MLGLSLVFLSFLTPPSTAPAISPAAFRQWFDSARLGKLAIPAKVERNARRFQYVFVGGFRAERPGTYFSQNAQELRAHGIPRRAVHYVFPSSDKTIDENAAEVRSQFHEIAEKGPEPLVIIAHSRGACDVLAFALREPEFVRDHIEAIFLIQGPFGGTALADYIHGDGPAMDRQMSARHRLVTHVLGWVEKFRLRRGSHGGLADLVRDESREYWSRMLESHSSAVPVVRPKTYFLQSAASPSRLGLFRRALGWYLTIYDGPNDGIVAVPDQFLPDLGTSLGVYDCGHGDLTSRSGRAKKRLQHALMRTIIMALGTERKASVRTVIVGR